MGASRSDGELCILMVAFELDMLLDTPWIN